MPAPFTNDRSTGPAMDEKSYEEILRLLERLHMDAERICLQLTDYLSRGKPPSARGVDDLIRRAVAAPDDDPLYVVAIGAITNVAAALLLEPDLVRKDRGGGWVGTRTTSRPMEFNLMQDPDAARVIFDSGVPFVRFLAGRGFAPSDHTQRAG